MQFLLNFVFLGHFNDAKCVHLPAGSGHLTTNFDIFLGACGMSSSGHSQGQLIAQQGQTSGLYIENTVVIQYDPQVQEIWDQARKLRYDIIINLCYNCK